MIWFLLAVAAFGLFLMLFPEQKLWDIAEEANRKRRFYDDIAKALRFRP